ncbi:hypothetical protein ASPACDRAFT_121211 [Aspergillus aculeatus ATCC 16872]|uniref:Ribonuclease H1 N-terminal domain-containing protein n=1 Tax=Aspergillus aculeatus (strain ATCC 16872 / CBS 172.66 / WB 5094) TaxID=690307 RepID=A0A1L9WRE6_ASPA1|nr:uncharacterized protein ASPACDRAFT_121211 [Aspergillus aculeatus ATCC 16872]OJJ98658.1 hypothetical protein ASPACDRAFT_121211 [Aspergillus aculeatus ATCC 16872]
MKKENKRYYAVFSGRVTEATIFSSWGDAHPYITGYHSTFKGFVTLSEAQKYLRAKGIDKPRLVVREGPKETRPQFSQGKFYAVALGRKPGMPKHKSMGIRMHVTSASRHMLKHKTSLATGRNLMQMFAGEIRSLNPQAASGRLTWSQVSMISSLERERTRANGSPPE